MKRIIHIVGLIVLAAFLSNALATATLPPPSASDDLVPLPQPATAKFTPYHTRTYAQVNGDSVLGHRLLRFKEADKNGHYTHPFEPVMDAGISELPVPEKLILSPKTLSLYEAIALALRNNPNVKIAELTRITNKFGLETAIHDRYAVQWQPFTFTPTIQNGAAPTWATTGGFGVKTSAGTGVALTHTNNLLGGLGSTTLTVTQPLLQNFGFAYNRIIYQNALDNEQIARLSFKNSVITVVTSVITSYRSLVVQYNNLDNDKKSLASQEQQAANDELQVKVGQMAPSDLIQQQENVEQTRLTMVQQEQTLRDAYYGFLTQLGLMPSTKLTIDRHILVGGEKVPSVNTCIKIALAHNVAYRTALLNLNITKRALISANNARKWSLTVTSAVTMESERSAVGQPITDSGSTNPSVAIALSVPIDNIGLKQAVVNAKIAIEDAKLNLEQQKETLVRNIMNQWDSVHNNYEQILVAQKALDYQITTLNNTKLRFRYGRTSMFEVNSLETDLLSQQNQLVSTKIQYLNAITTLYQTMGITLEEWHVKLRY